MSKGFTIIVIAVLVAAAAAQDHCNEYLTCQDCVAAHLCGWCSTPVTYTNGAPGFQCAGFNQNGSNPFICNGIYSTDTCQRGYVCNETTYECELSAPGAGQQKAQCEANCSTTGKTFICDNATHTCVLAPAGSGTSHDQCMTECSPTQSPQTENPASHNPASNNPSSNSPSSDSPEPTPAPTYVCNGTTEKCEQGAPGQGASLAVCEEGCKPSNVTPPSLLGLWRTFPLDVASSVVETDLNFYDNNTVGIRNRAVDAVCKVVSIGQEVHFVDCTSIQPSLKCMYESTLTMPETYHAMLACNYGGGAAPGSFAEAMADAAHGQPVAVAFMSRCVPDGFCQFRFGPSASQEMRAARAAHGLSALHAITAGDPCTAYGANCSFCLSHQFCGWCSAVVVYKDGSPGTQCAGFSADPDHKDQWTCSGSYSTEMCQPGWVCEPVNQTCVPTIPGSGVPEADCNTACKAKPGPPSQLIGNWRGLFIQQQYPFGIVSVNITQETIVAALNGQKLFEGTMKSLAADVFITYTSGPNKGKTIAGIFTNSANELVQFIEITFGGDNQGAPANYKEGMKSPNIELVLAKCASPNCEF